MRRILPGDVSVTMVDSDKLFVDVLVRHCAGLEPPVYVHRLDPLDPRLWLRLAAEEPDIVTVDPDQFTDAVGTISRISEVAPRARVLVLSLSHGDDLVAQLARSRVRGWVGKEEPVAAFVEAVRLLSGGGARFRLGHVRGVTHSAHSRPALWLTAREASLPPTTVRPHPVSTDQTRPLPHSRRSMPGSHPSAVVAFVHEADSVE